MNTGLSKAKVSRLAHMFDEDCTGTIERDEYYETL